MYPGCKETIEWLYHDLGFEIYFITARAYKNHEDICKAATISWIESQGLPYTDIIIDNKKTGYDLDLLIDDSPVHVENAVVHGENTVIYDQAWNKDISFVDRVFGWEHIRSYIEERIEQKVVV